jgi:uncharacterized protein (UPF0332 family)
MREDSQGLAQKAQEGLQVARDLFAGGHNDFAAGRAYYAMYNMAQAVLLEKGQSFSSHRARHNGFFHEFIRTELLDRSYHQSLVRGFELRQAGDYSGYASVTKQQCEDLLERATRFIEAVRLLLG